MSSDKLGQHVQHACTHRQSACPRRGAQRRAAEHVCRKNLFYVLHRYILLWATSVVELLAGLHDRLQISTCHVRSLSYPSLLLSFYMYACLGQCCRSNEAAIKLVSCGELSHGAMQQSESGCDAGQHVGQVVSQAAGGPSTWGALTWLAPPPPAVLPPYLYSFAQVRLHRTKVACSWPPCPHRLSLIRLAHTCC